MSNKPDWKYAPGWAQYLAQDKNGDWCFFLEKPILGLFHWLPRRVPESGDAFEYANPAIIGNGATSLEWKATLERRP